MKQMIYITAMSMITIALSGFAFAGTDMKFTVKDAEKASAGMSGSNTKIGVLGFLKARRDVRWTRVPHKVLAFYYTWYGRPENHGNWVHWKDVKPDEHDIASSTHYPAKGAYDSQNPEIIDYHIKLAKDHGIDAFICTWWGQGRFDDRAFVKVLDRAEKHDFKVTVYWETAPGNGKAKIAQAVDDLLYVLDKYAGHPAFLKVDGKPVIFVYGRVMGQVSTNEWPEIISLAQKRYGKDFLLIADGYRESYTRLFDGIHTYNICGWVQGKTPDELRESSRRSFTDAVQMAKNHGKISCITIIPGYNDTKIRTPGINAERLDGETYRVLWEQAIEADPDWVLITSWNEWHEGSEIEPSWEDGDKYIKITGEYTARFKKTQYSSVKIPESPSGVSPEKARKLRELYGNKTIGIMPGFSSGAAFWLSDTGVNVKELTWEEMLDPAKFSATNFPVVVYASNEHYTQTLREKNDVDDAIVRYLKEGGLIVALSSHPFPFFYNESGNPVVSARKFGFPISGGWETPPDGVKLTFEIDNGVLKSLPASVPFPKTGDLRWRPSTGANLPAGDIYHPLAQLKDETGRNYGDGIVYIQHKASQPKNGKNIYTWMRMPDIMDTNDVLYEIFRLAGEKMND